MTSSEIEEFKELAKTHRIFCEMTFEEATISILTAKFAYYEHDSPLVSDAQYDEAEKVWYMMGRTLGLIKADETSPCIGFNYNHPKAKDAIKLYGTLKK